MSFLNKITTIISLLTLTNTFYLIYNSQSSQHRTTLIQTTPTLDNADASITRQYCDPNLIKSLESVKKHQDLYPIVLDDYDRRFITPIKPSNQFLFDSPNKYIDVSIFWMEFELFEIRYFSLFEVTELFIVFENSIDHFGLYKGCLLKESKLFKHIRHKLYYWCDSFVSGEKGLNHEFKFSKFVWNMTIDIVNDHKIQNSYIGFSHVDEIPSEFSIFNLLNKRERTGVIYQDGVFFYGNHKLIYGNIYMEDTRRNYSYPYPVIWPQELMKIPPRDFKYRECFKDCPKMDFGVHLSPWPNPITEAIKYLMCSECEGRSIENVKKHCKKIGNYKTMMPGGHYYNVIPKPVILPRYLSDNRQKFQSFFIDFYD